MAHAISKDDKGYVYGTTWHNMDEYVQLERPVTFEEATKVMDFPLEKLPLTLIETDDMGNEKRRNVGAWCIKRSDTDRILVDSVGARFNVLNNRVLLDFVKEEFLDECPDLEIESVGTLFGGATTFVNLKLDEFHVKGDESPTLSRLMYSNPLGNGTYRACCHNVRIVCNNTLRAAEAQGAANKTLARISHTINAARRISDHLIGLAEVRMGLDVHRQKLDWLANQEMDSEYVQNFLEKFYVVDEQKASSRAAAHAATRRDDITRIFETQSHLNGISRTRYALLQAVTQHVGTFDVGSRIGSAAIEWDALDGQRAKKKDKALDLLMTV